jgi:hypothetical protein
LRWHCKPRIQNKVRGIAAVHLPRIAAAAAAAAALERLVRHKLLQPERDVLLVAARRRGRALRERRQRGVRVVAVARVALAADDRAVGDAVLVEQVPLDEVAVVALLRALLPAWRSAAGSCAGGSSSK